MMYCIYVHVICFTAYREYGMTFSFSGSAVLGSCPSETPIKMYEMNHVNSNEPLLQQTNVAISLSADENSSNPANQRQASLPWTRSQIDSSGFSADDI